MLSSRRSRHKCVAGSCEACGEATWCAQSDQYDLTVPRVVPAGTGMSVLCEADYSYPFAVSVFAYLDFLDALHEIGRVLILIELDGDTLGTLR